MSWQAVQAVMDYSRSKGSERLVLMVIATHADKDSMDTHIGLDRLCAEANMKRRNLIYTLAKLEESGELKISHARGSGNVNSYSLVLSENVQPIAPLKPEPVKSAEPQKVQSIVRKGAIQRQERCNVASEKVQSIAPVPEEPEKQPIKQKPSRDKRVGVVLANSEGLSIQEYIGRLIAYRQQDLNVKKLPAEGKEVGAAKYLFDNDWPIRQVQACYQDLKKQKWRQTPVDLMTVKATIADWAQGNISSGGNNGSNQRGSEKKPSLTDRAKQYNDYYGRGTQARAC